MSNFFMVANFVIECVIFALQSKVIRPFWAILIDIYIL